MHAEENKSFYESSVRFDANRIRAAAVYCSDGRFGEQFDDLLRNALQLPRYDRLAVPGGAACLASHFATYREEEGVFEQLRFLVNVHGLECVVAVLSQVLFEVSPHQLDRREFAMIFRQIHEEDVDAFSSQGILAVVENRGGDTESGQAGLLQRVEDGVRPLSQ